MLCNVNEIMDNAKIGKYCVPQFNINNLEWTRYILEECNDNNSPVILGVSESASKYMGGYFTVSNMVKGLIKDLNISVPVILHLDHGSSFESCKSAIDSGFTSVMIDASKYELDKNIEITKEVVAYAHKNNVTVEAEIGSIGSNGTISEDLYAKVSDCITLYEETKVDMLAPALGSVHGLYKEEPNLDFDRMKEISEKLNIPLVLHGGTGIEDDKLKKAISCGICKININTELQVAWATAVREFLESDNKVYDPRKIIRSGEQAIKKCVSEKIEILGSRDKTLN